MIYDFQRASMLKRAPAWLLDIILLITLATGLIAGMSALLNVDSSQQALDDIYRKYEVEYNVDFAKVAEMSQEALEEMPEEEKAKYEAAYAAMDKDSELQAAYQLYLNLTLVTLAIGILGAFLVLELLVPLLLKNGQTLGKKVFGVALMRKDGIKVTPFMMFARSILGKYTVETMVPVLFIVGLGFNAIGGIGLIILVLFLLAQIIVPLATRDKTAFHDMMACTVAVDLSSQMIFDSLEAQEEYHKRLHEENTAEADK